MTLFSKSPLDGIFKIKYPQRKIKCYDAIYVAKSLGQGHYWNKGSHEAKLITVRVL